MFSAIFKVYWQLILFQRRPEDTPYSLFLLGFSAVIYLALVVVQWLMVPLNAGLNLATALAAGMTLLVSYLLFVWIILAARNLMARFVQTLTCLWMAHFLMHCFALPLLWATPYMISGAKDDPWILLGGLIYFFGTILLSVWQFMITVTIFRSAMSTQTLQALIASIGLLAINILTVSLWR